MTFVHYCVYCGWSREASSSTMLAPHCERCGGSLKASTQEEFSGLEPALTDEHVARSHHGDITAAFAVLVAFPFILPLFGVRISDIAFAVPFGMLTFATVRCLAAASRSLTRRGVWLSFAAANGLAGASSALAVAAALLGDTLTGAFYLGAGGSVGLLVGILLLARGSVRAARVDRIVDALLFCGVIAAVGGYFVAIPGFAHGDALLTSVFILDVAVVFGATLVLFGRRGHLARRLGWWILLAAVAAAAGDGLVSAAAAGQAGSSAAVTALLWTVAGFALAAAAEEESDQPEPQEAEGEEVTGWRWVGVRVVLPLAAVASFPGLALGIWIAEGRLRSWEVVYFGIFFSAALVIAFGRQAYLLADNLRAIARERRLRRDMGRRAAELEALTGLATTMTQTLEESPIIEQALGVLHLAARSTSSALHVGAPGAFKLAATTGQWQDDQPWVSTPAADPPAVEMQTRGRRSITRLRLEARGHLIGVVTVVRPAAEPLDRDRVQLLRLLVDEMGVAIQNARDYREKLEQAIRDPLTSLYNRRFFFEALDKEVNRSERYGSPSSLLIFDVDDFKQVNDVHGHAAGDDVLRKIGHIGSSMLRPVDSFARIGGEEFAVLLPETQQLDALLVAERLRTAISRSALLPDRRVTISVGVSSCPQDAVSREELERKADAALYWAKRHGKDLCAVASEVTAVEDQQEGDGILAHLYAMVSAIDARQLHTRDHSENVAAYAVAIGQALGLDREHIMCLRRAALLHDIGKVTVSGEILAKPEALTEPEFAAIRRHPEAGASMLRHAGLTDEALWIRHHHERMDGNGYPDGLAGDEIPLEARIIFVADSFEAMTSDRPYREGMDVCDAIVELQRHGGTQFDCRVESALRDLIARGELAVLALRGERLEARR